MKRLKQKILLLSSALLLACACSSDRPKGILSESELESVLYDVHLAQGLAMVNEKNGNRDELELTYRDAVFKKHGITQATFDSTMLYYNSHAQVLLDIYERLAKRYEKDGATASAAPQSTQVAKKFSVGGDTVNVWTASSDLLLCSQGKNYQSYTISVDSTWRSGDCLEWHMSSLNYYKEGDRTAMALMRLEFDNDSVALVNTMVHMGEQCCKTQIPSHVKLRSLRCYVQQNVRWTKEPSVLYLHDMYLLRIRESRNKGVATPTLQKDSVSTIDTTKNEVKAKKLRENFGQ